MIKFWWCHEICKFEGLKLASAFYIFNSRKQLRNYEKWRKKAPFILEI